MDTKDLGVLVGGMAAIYGLSHLRSRSSASRTEFTVKDFDKQIEKDAAETLRLRGPFERGRGIDFYRDEQYAATLLGSSPLGAPLPEVYKDLAVDSAATNEETRGGYYKAMLAMSDKSSPVRSTSAARRLEEINDGFLEAQKKDLDAVHGLVLKALEARNRLFKEANKQFFSDLKKPHLTLVK